MAGRSQALGATRSCPHCRATILDSAIICPGCRHHLRFGGEAEAQAAAQERETAWQVEGELTPRTGEPELEYTIVVTVRDAAGREVARRLVDCGGLPAGDRRSFSLSIETARPRGLAATRKPGT